MKTPRTTRAALTALACAITACSTAPKQPSGPPVAVQDDRIAFLGTDADVGRWQGAKTRVVDLHGQMMMPGLVDAHVHAFSVVQPDVCDLQRRPMPLAALAEFVRACVARYQVPKGEWLKVMLWNFSEGNEPDPRHPTLTSASWWRWTPPESRAGGSPRVRRRASARRNSPWCSRTPGP
jgi:predicted amidohydrolase YtcJ